MELNPMVKSPGCQGNTEGSRAVRGSQTAVRNEVSNAQKNTSPNVTVYITANSSASSLQLSLENKKLVRAREEFAKKFSDFLKGKTDVIGYAFAINGEINSADIYVSNHFFQKLWPKKLNATVTEAISLADKSTTNEHKSVAKSKVVARSSKNEVVYEARGRANIVVHRSHVKLN